jgi:hypothetical protein
LIPALPFRWKRAHEETDRHFRRRSGQFPVSTPTSSPARTKINLEPFTEPSPQEIKKETNPFTEADWRMWTYAWSGFLLRVMLVFGAAFSVYQYLVQREEKRVERTFALIELWERPEYQDAQRLCGSGWSRCMTD